MVLNRLKQKFLNSSDSYNYYKAKAKKLKSTIKY